MRKQFFKFEIFSFNFSFQFIWILNWRPRKDTFLYDFDYSKYEVMDGLQRLTTFSRYLADDFALSFEPVEDQPAHPLDGKKFSNRH